MITACCCVIYFSLTIYIRDILPTNDFIGTLLPIFLLYYVLPLILCGLYVLFLKWKHIGHDISRLMLLCMVIAIYSINTFNNAVDQIFMPYILASTFTIVVATIITYFWKISLHTIGMGGLVAITIICARMMPLLALKLVPIVVVCAGLVGFARLYLQAHTHAQIHVGFAVGFVTTLGGIIVLAL